MTTLHEMAEEIRAQEEPMTVSECLAVFEAGCANTAPFGHPPENCPTCVRAFVNAVKDRAAWEAARRGTPIR